MSGRFPALPFRESVRINTGEERTFRLVALPICLVIASRLALSFVMTIGAVRVALCLCRSVGDPWPSISLPHIMVIGAAGALLLLTVDIMVRKWHIPSEYARKFAHVGAGAIALLISVFFSTHWAVFVVALIFSATLLLSQRFGWLSCIHFPAQRSKGAVLLLWAVYLVFLLSKGDRLLFQIPVLVLSVGDAAAALVGQRYGRIRYRVLDTVRTLEGSVAFVVSAFACILFFFLGTTQMSLVESAVLSALVATAASVVEAFSPEGFDNLTIPISALLLLEFCLR